MITNLKITVTNVESEVSLVLSSLFLLFFIVQDDIIYKFCHIKLYVHYWFSCRLITRQLIFLFWRKQKWWINLVDSDCNHWLFNIQWHCASQFLCSVSVNLSNVCTGACLKCEDRLNLSVIVQIRWRCIRAWVSLLKVSDVVQGNVSWLFYFILTLSSILFNCLNEFLNF